MQIIGGHSGRLLREERLPTETTAGGRLAMALSAIVAEDGVLSQGGCGRGQSLGEDYDPREEHKTHRKDQSVCFQSRTSELDLGHMGLMLQKGSRGCANAASRRKLLLA